MQAGIRSIRRLAICAFLVGFASSWSFQTMAEELSPFAKEVAKTLRYSDADVRKVLAGELVIHQMNDETKKELALTAAVEAPRSPQVIFADMQSRAFFEVDRTIHAWGSIEKFPVTAESLAKLVMPDAELDALLGVRPGSDFNLSEAEIVSLQATAKRLKGRTKVERRNGIMQTYRELLAARVNAYRNGGLDGIAPYHRGRKFSYPARDLAGALPAPDSPIARHAPEFYRRLRQKPIDATFRSDAQGVEDRFLWVLQELNGRPAVVLAHRVVSLDGGEAFMAQRDFYVSHTFDALQVLVGVLPNGPDESIIIYANRTYTEQVAGFASGAAHSIGRKIMTKEVQTLFESILAKFQAEDLRPPD
jgi:hypothetical protein